MRRKAFTLLELIFVIVIMGILSKFGVEFLMQAYNTFIYSKINSELQSKSELAVQTIANRLQYRIPQSTIKRIGSSNAFTLAPQPVGNPDDYNILEWIGYDIDGFRGNGTPLWSGVIDLNNTLTTNAKLFSPDTSTTAIDDLIKALSNNGSTIANAAILFNSADYDIDGFGWDGSATALTDHTKAMHPIKANSNIEEFETGFATGNFSGIRVYNRYFLAWTAYAVVHETATSELKLYYNYQPWQGEAYTDGTAIVLMQNVDTFRIRPSSDGTLFNIIVCAESNLTVGGVHSLCKEKVIF
ncbi:MAG: type II secretion system protein [Sulfurimonas sp.]|nr:type II secretion system protein [Sulfurimonas sp.]